MVFQLECFLVGSVLALVLKPCGLECHANNTLLYLRAPIDAPLDEMHSVFLLINCNPVVVYQYVWAHSCALSQGHTQQHTLAYIHTLIVMINVPLLGDKINQFLCRVILRHQRRNGLSSLSYTVPSFSLLLQSESCVNISGREQFSEDTQTVNLTLPYYLQSIYDVPLCS